MTKSWMPDPSWNAPTTCPHVVDAKGLGGVGGHGIIEGEVSTTTQQEPMESGGIGIRSDDLACIVNAKRIGAKSRQGIIEGYETADRARGTGEMKEAVLHTTRVVERSDYL